jgi:phosphonate metabolism protein PhnN/1,5-bisphosphokinase (PRPP-forming)
VSAVATAGAEAGRGRLILVVGPSGAGKDSLIAWCRARFAGNAAIVFPRRIITRAVADSSEDHDIIAESEYRQRAALGGFALHWRAHGLGYGIPASIAEDLAAGRVVVVNVSRAVLDLARHLYPPVIVVSVTVPPEVLAERLRRRRRETEEDITGRLARAGAYDVTGPDVVALDNSGTIPTAGAQLAAIIAAGSR